MTNRRRPRPTMALLTVGISRSSPRAASLSCTAFRNTEQARGERMSALLTWRMAYWHRHLLLSQFPGYRSSAGNSDGSPTAPVSRRQLGRRQAVVKRRLAHSDSTVFPTVALGSDQSAVVRDRRGPATALHDLREGDNVPHTCRVHSLRGTGSVQFVQPSRSRLRRITMPRGLGPDEFFCRHAEFAARSLRSRVGDGVRCRRGIRLSCRVHSRCLHPFGADGSALVRGTTETPEIKHQVRRHCGPQFIRSV